DSVRLPQVIVEAERVLREVFALEAFRSGQADVVEAMLAGRDVLSVAPTGSGKSISYWVPAVVDGGLTLVVSPLIALMKDQVDRLTARGVADRSLRPAAGSGLYGHRDAAGPGRHRKVARLEGPVHIGHRIQPADADALCGPVPRRARQARRAASLAFKSGAARTRLRGHRQSSRGAGCRHGRRLLPRAAGSRSPPRDPGRVHAGTHQGRGR